MTTGCSITHNLFAGSWVLGCYSCRFLVFCSLSKPEI